MRLGTQSENRSNVVDVYVRCGRDPGERAILGALLAKALGDGALAVTPEE